MGRLDRRLRRLEARRNVGQPQGVLEVHFALAGTRPHVSEWMQPCAEHESCRVHAMPRREPGTSIQRRTPVRPDTIVDRVSPFPLSSQRVPTSSGRLRRRTSLSAKFALSSALDSPRSSPERSCPVLPYSRREADRVSACRTLQLEPAILREKPVLRRVPSGLRFCNSLRDILAP
jgi:hypothetical protein